MQDGEVDTGVNFYQEFDFKEGVDNSINLEGEKFRLRISTYRHIVDGKLFPRKLMLTYYDKGDVENDTISGCVVGVDFICEQLNKAKKDL